MNEDLKGLLVQRLGEEGMSAGVPITVAELHRHLLPYPVCRERLGYASKAEYDIGLLRMLSDEHSMVVPEDALVQAVRRELATPEPGLALLQRFAASEVRVRLPRDRKSEGGDREPVPAESVRVETGPPVASLETGRSRGDYIKGLDDPLFVPVDEAADALGIRAPVAGDDQAPAQADECRSCGRALPKREGVRYCPECGADQHRWPCPSCGEEVERGWSYCALCGKLLRT